MLLLIFSHFTQLIWYERFECTYSCIVSVSMRVWLLWQLQAFPSIKAHGSELKGIAKYFSLEISQRCLGSNYIINLVSINLIFHHSVWNFQIVLCRPMIIIILTSFGTRQNLTLRNCLVNICWMQFQFNLLQIFKENDSENFKLNFFWSYSRSKIYWYSNTISSELTI